MKPSHATKPTPGLLLYSVLPEVPLQRPPSEQLLLLTLSVASAGVPLCVCSWMRYRPSAAELDRHAMQRLRPSVARE